MEYEDKKMELFKLAAMATLKEQGPAETGFDEALWGNYRKIESGFDFVGKKLEERSRERARKNQPPCTMV